MDTIILDIGYIKYKTKKQTLLKYDTIFKDLLENTIENNEIFIDRNGKIFEYILEYYRNGDNIFIPKDEILINSLILECKYYCLLEFEKKLSDELKILKNKGKIIDHDYIHQNSIPELLKKAQSYYDDGYEPINIFPSKNDKGYMMYFVKRN